MPFRIYSVFMEKIHLRIEKVLWQANMVQCYLIINNI